MTRVAHIYLLNHEFIEWELCAGHCTDKHLITFNLHKEPFVMGTTFILILPVKNLRLSKIRESNVCKITQLEIKPRISNLAPSFLTIGWRWQFLFIYF